MGTDYKIPKIKPNMKKIFDKSRSIDFSDNLSKKKKPINILIIHDNKLDYHTQKAHRLKDWMDKTSQFSPIIDTDYFQRNKNYSPTKINHIEKTMVKITDIGVRLVSPTSSTGESRHEGGIREYKKLKNAGKSIIEIYYQGARTSPNRPIQDKNYKNRIPIHIKRGESLEKAIQRGWEIYTQRK